MISESGSHGWCAKTHCFGDRFAERQSMMNTYEMVITTTPLEMKAQLLLLLGLRPSAAGEGRNHHTKGQVKPLYERSADRTGEAKGDEFLANR